jgi:hypothetical protein
MIQTRWDGPGCHASGWDDTGWNDPDRFIDEAELWTGEEGYSTGPDLSAQAADATSVWARWEGVHATGETDVAISARIGDLEALITQLQAWQARELRTLRAMRLAEQGAVHGPDPRPERVDPDGWLPSEVGFALGLSEHQVRARLAFGEGLERFRRVGDLVGQGGVPGWTAVRLLDHLTALAGLLSADRLAEVEAATVAWLRDRPRTVGQLNARMKRLLVRARAEYDAANPVPDAPDQPADGSTHASLDQAVTARHADRGVQVRSLGDGCAELWALLPESDALAVIAALDGAAPALVDLPAASGETRTRSQRRADLLVSALTGAPACYGRAEDVPGKTPTSSHDVRRCLFPGGVRPVLEVTVPVATLVGDSLEPGHCPGYGPVHPLTCRDLASDAADAPGPAGRGVLYDPTTGRLLGLARRVELGPITWVADLPAGAGYQHPPTVDTAARVRDRTCRAPGCTRPARACDIDHVTPWPDGATSLANAAVLCRYHHRLKTHAPGWTVGFGSGHGDDEALIWTGPTGPARATGPHDHRPDGQGDHPSDGASEVVDHPPF